MAVAPAAAPGVPDLKDVPAHLKMGLGLDLKPKKQGGITIRDGVFFEKDPAVTAPRAARTLETFGTLLATRKAGETITTVKPSTDYVAPHAALVGQTLQFTAYYMESVHESPTETFRVRQNVLRYYLVDNTLEIIEPPESNSGLPQGKMLKRHAVPKPGGKGPLLPSDITVGGYITLYGRRLKIAACTESTRKWYETNGSPQPADEPVRDDAFRATMRTVADRRGPDVYHGRQRNSMKTFMEARLGAGPRNEGRAKFSTLDGKVLRFYGQWDDTGTMFGTKQNFRIMYYLADDTISVSEELPPNCGKDNFPNLIKRSKLRKEVRVTGPADASDGPDQYYTADDLRVGSTFNVLGREVLLYDCDEFTQKWYADNKGVDQKASAVSVEEPEAPKPERVVPPPTGFGSEEDSLASVRGLMPKAPKRNWEKLTKFSDKVLRFSAVLESDKPVDKGRNFVVTWYLADDTMAVFEPPIRNSGIVAGPWLKRGVVINSETGKRIEAADLVIGARLPIAREIFVLTGADEYSHKTMEGHATVWPMESIDFVLKTLRSKLGERSGKLQKVFRAFDTDKSHTITKDEFKFMLEYYGMDITDAECTTIFRNYDQSRTGKLTYEQFCAVFAEDPTGAELDHKLVRDDATDDEIARYAEMVKEVRLAEEDEAKVKLLLTRFADVFTSAKKEQAIAQKFRDFDVNKDHTVSREEFRTALSGAVPGIFTLNEDDVRVLEAKFFPVGQETIDYGKFMSVIKAQAYEVSRRK